MTFRTNAHTLATLTLAFFFSSFISQAQTTFVFTNGAYEDGSVIDWLVSNSGTPDGGAPYTIVIPEEVAFEIDSLLSI